MKENTYLIANAFTSNGKIPMEYRIIVHKRDMRYSFCKKHDHEIINRELLNSLITKHNMVAKGDRVIAPNGRTGYEFLRDLNAK